MILQPVCRVGAAAAARRRSSGYAGRRRKRRQQCAARERRRDERRVAARRVTARHEPRCDERRCDERRRDERRRESGGAAARRAACASAHVPYAYAGRIRHMAGHTATVMRSCCDQHMVHLCVRIVLISVLNQQGHKQSHLYARTLPYRIRREPCALSAHHLRAPALEPRACKPCNLR